MFLKNFHYPHRCHFGILSLNLVEPSKVFILGENGIGKSSFAHSLAFAGTEATFETNLELNKVFLSKFTQTNSFLCTKDALQIILKDNFSNDYFNLHEFLKIPLKNLSSGQLQRFWLTIAFHQDCDLLILDEPTTYLDFSSRKNLLNVIQNFSKNLFVISHELEFFQQYLDYVLCLRKNENQIYQMKDFQKLGII